MQGIRHADLVKQLSGELGLSRSTVRRHIRVMCEGAGAIYAREGDMIVPKHATLNESLAALATFKPDRGATSR